MAGRRASQGLDSLPSSGSVDLYESAEEHSLPGSRGNSLSGPPPSQRRSADLVSRTSSMASARGGSSVVVDTASSPDPSRLGRPPSGSAAAPASAAVPADAAADQLMAVSLDDARGQQQQQPQGPGEQSAPPVSPGAPTPPGWQHQQQQRPEQTPQQPSVQPPRGIDAAAGAGSSEGETREAAAGASGAGGLGAAPREQLPPGAALFSVPMASAPTTGIYSIPQEMFRIRDLDAGKEYSLDQRYWIKDIDTGTVYVIEGEDGGAASGAAAATGGAAGEGRVTELLSGRELSLDEFEDALGFFKVPQPAPPPQHTLGGPALSSSSSGGGSGVSGVQAAAQRSFKSFTSGATWVKASVGGMLSSLKPQHAQQQTSPRSGQPSGDGAGPMAAGAAAGGGFSGVERSVGSGGGPPPPLSSLDDRQGQPVKVQVYRKSYKEFTDLRLVQQLGGHSGVVWALKFSRNGRFLASAGQDCLVRVWEVAPTRGSGSSPSTPVESEVSLEDAAAAAGGGGEGGGSSLLADPSVAVFQQRPYRVYRGHKQDVLDLCWSKTQFLLSASMDKTVRLWHVSMDECLRVFKHTDFVTAIDFHPLDDKMFLSGSIDGKVRLWNIPEQRVVSWQDVHEMVTAVAYSQDGRKAVVGTMKGKCRFYTIEKSALEYEAQLDVKNKRGQHARGKKVTGLAFLPAEPGKLLITSNDSRVRLYDGYTLRCKYKGHTNRNTQIRASFSPGGDYITCGSDDGWVYIWGTRKSGVPPSGGTAGGAAGGGAAASGGSFTDEADNPLAKEKNASYECFQANGDVVTVAVFAPAACHRAADSFSPTGAAAHHQRSDSLGDRAEGEAALAVARARGQVLVTAGYTGEIKIYENIGLPQWL